MRSRRSLAALLAGALLLVGALVPTGGCGLPTGDLVVYPADAPELANASVSPEGIWQSAPWSSADTRWFPYPGRATVQLEHSLGRVPTVVLVYLSFEENGAEAALAAGDLSRVIEVDASTISIRNDTSALFFARVVAW